MKGRLQLNKSSNWKDWKAIIDEKTCLTCKKNNGKIYNIDETPLPSPPIHLFCRCTVSPMRTMQAGTATKNGINGADWQLKYHGILPDYYIEKSVADRLGYDSSSGNLDEVAPGKTLSKGIYRNLNGHLPSAYGRIWYEADINYSGGFRGTERILFSNDGLIFVTYDHYETFVEII